MLIVPISSIVDVVETDSAPKRGTFGMQVITDDRVYRFCVSSEDELVDWIGRIKSAMARGREARY